MNDELFNDLPAPEDVDARRINPWRRPITLLSWGIFLTTVSFTFLELDRLLPPVGMVLMVLGLRSLRRENRGFRAAFLLSGVRLVLLFAAYAARAMAILELSGSYLLTLAAAALQVGQLVALRAGLAEVFDRTDTPRRLAAVNWLIAFNLVLALGMLLNVGETGIFGIVMLLGYIAVIVAVSRLPASLNDTGCALRNAPVRLSDAPCAVTILAALLVLTAASFLAGLALRTPPAEPFAPAEDAALPGELPAEIAELLTPEDAALFSEGTNIQAAWSDGMYDLAGRVRLGTVTAQLPGAKLLILHYFRWLDGAPAYGDCVTAWNSSRLTRVDAPRGALIYERGGETFRSAFANLASGARTRHGFFTDTDLYIWADLYVPPDARNARGYLLYTVSAGSEQPLHYNCELEYYHRSFLDAWQNPSSPSDALFSGRFDRKTRTDFLTLFSAWPPAR